MKLKITLARYNGSSALACVEDGKEREIELADCTTPKAACLTAAKALREAADRFALLAQEPEPYHPKTHDRIHRVQLQSAWRNPAAELPDDEITVVIRLAGDDEYVALGYHDGDAWHLLGHKPGASVRGWMHIHDAARIMDAATEGGAA